jgi:hypothetical protein
MSMNIRPVQRAFVNDPMRAKQFSVVNSAKPEDLHQPLYDRVNISTAVPSQLSFFSTPVGQSATIIRAAATGSNPKTKRDTNLEVAGVVPTKLFQFIGLSVAYIPIQSSPTSANTVYIGDDIFKLKYGGWIDFRIIDKVILQIPLHFIPETTPMNGISTTNNNVTGFSSGILSASPFPMYKLGIPITLEPFQQFVFQVNFDGSITLQQSYDMQVLFHAFMRRPT